MKIDKTERTITITQNTGVTMSIAFILLAMGGLASTVTWVNAVNSRQDSLADSVRAQRVEINELRDSGTATQLNLAEINTRLRSIDTTLQELRAPR